MDFAHTMLERAGEFYPFGAMLSREGQIAAVGGYNGEEHPPPAEIYQLLSQSFAASAGQGTHLGFALAANVTIPTKYSAAGQDGLRVHLESPGYARFIYVPYLLSKQGFLKRRRVAQFGEPFAVEIAPGFFADAAESGHSQ
ncbi:MAG: hypothetical protein IIA03_04315 [Proteobacteria bacterium]|nr:hypothetical protein [Burkholderiaceae bacterium]MCH8855463.1 hypothetical protein [Pseudomonadota bacterium]